MDPSCDSATIESGCYSNKGNRGSLAHVRSTALSGGGLPRPGQPAGSGLASLDGALDGLALVYEPSTRLLRRAPADGPSDSVSLTSGSSVSTDLSASDEGARQHGRLSAIKGLLAWKSKNAGDERVPSPRDPSPTPSKQSADGCVPSSTTALILEKRPSNLPAKNPEEEQKHKQEYEEMVKAARKKDNGPADVPLISSAVASDLRRPSSSGTADSQPSITCGTLKPRAVPTYTARLRLGVALGLTAHRLLAQQPSTSHGGFSDQRQCISELKDARARKKQMQQQWKQEEQLSQATRTWVSEVLPCWEVARSQRRIRDLWWQGLPPSVRGRVWKLAIGNELNITSELYEICASRSRKIWLSEAVLEESSALHTREQSAHLIRLDVSRTFPQLGIFQEAGPYFDVLHCILGAYVVYRPDIGYVQGMSFLAAMLLLNMEVDDAFICFANLLNRPCQLAFFRVDQPQHFVTLL
ncbi:hypothetical protein HPB50_016732 [Hyalomma asiaticum]|uniref:Uncharacterized protein n=1 Tax=Hyalomma asiaticum TaxID=266040 RepID=A0ACB7TJ05_HYAAI|nr:hypothetical protein HPB50_016732 [Hyalomma asiaticum]